MPPERSGARAEPARAAGFINPAAGAWEGAASPPPRRPRRLRLVLTAAIAAASVLALPSDPALAASGKTQHRAGRAHVAAIAASRHVRSARLAHAPTHAKHTRARTARGRIDARPAAVAAPATAAVHTDVVPLMNTTWDHPAPSPVVLGAIRAAARDKGVDPNLLMALAWRESRFDPRARNRRSSANGLLQFTSGTWLQTVHDFGARHGAEAYAAAIQRQRSGGLTVRDRRLRSEILRLRGDPVLSAALAAEAMARRRDAMQAQLGRSVAPADLYLLHVLGPSGSARFLATVGRRPSASSLEVADRKTLRNAGLLARDGRPMTVANTYAAVQVMLDAQRAHSGPLLAVADGVADPSPPALWPPALTEVSQAP